MSFVVAKIHYWRQLQGLVKPTLALTDTIAEIYLAYDQNFHKMKKDQTIFTILQKKQFVNCWKRKQQYRKKSTVNNVLNKEIRKEKPVAKSGLEIKVKVFLTTSKQLIRQPMRLKKAQLYQLSWSYKTSSDLTKMGIHARKDKCQSDN